MCALASVSFNAPGRPPGGSEPGASTLTLPCMLGWIVHEYANVPGVVNVTLKLSPALRRPESNSPPAAVTVCGPKPRFVQITLWPASTISSAGW